MSPTAGKSAVPYTLMFNVKPDLSHLRQFGCTAYVLTPKHQRDGKLAPVSTSGLFVGYPDGTKGYKVYVPGQDIIVISRDVRFVESASSSSYLPPAHLFKLPATAEEEETSGLQQQEQQSGGGTHQDGPDISPDNPDLTSPESDDEEEDYNRGGLDREQSYTVMWPTGDDGTAPPAAPAPEA